MLIIPGNDHRTFNNPSVWIPLFEIQLAVGEIYYLTPCPEVITADYHDYQPFPIMIEELRDDGKGEVATVSMTVSNITGALGSAIKNNPGIDSQPVTFKVWSVEQGAVVYQETMEIIKVSSISSASITFELGMFNPYTARLLHEKFLRDFCWNRYKGAGCWFKRTDGSYASPPDFLAGSPDTCTKKISDCARHVNVWRFNSFPGIPGSGGFV
jgi:phage-related protein